MDAFWSLTGFLPLLVYGLLMYGLFVVLPRWLKSKWAGKASPKPPGKSAEAAQTQSRQPVEDASPPSSDAVSETVSVILRRQVPPRFDEGARSWLGGLPCMPEELEWPRSISSEHPDQGERPLHFVAQICCADLPAELWGGLGPREGWLLLFIDPNQGTPEGSDAFRILHVPRLGPEREPPFDLGPVHDGVFTGPSYGVLLPGENVPSVWRRWPVDLVTVSNEARDENGRVLVSPDDLASLLYPDQEIAADRHAPPAVQPFTYGQALHSLYELRAAVERPTPMQLTPAIREEMHKEGAIAERKAYCAAEARRLRDDESAPPAEQRVGGDPAQRARWYSATIARFEREEAWLSERKDADSVLAYFEESPALETAWLEGVRNKIDAVIEVVGQRDADAPLAENEWNEMVAAFEGLEFTRWRRERAEAGPDKPAIAFREHSRTVSLRPPAAMPHLVADLYVHASKRALIPAEVRSQLEPHWRQLRDNRPHRMGGYHDGLQSDATIGPARELLLFQIASDEAMRWCWGDVGAYYFWIRPKHLERGDYSGVQMHLECH